jgi:hypothetical protein
VNRAATHGAEDNTNNMPRCFPPATRGFRVAEACHCPSGLTSSAHHRLPGGCTDVVTLLPGPRDLHAPQLLAEAQRLMASGGYLAVAWNDRWVLQWRRPVSV